MVFCQLWRLWARAGGRMVPSAPHTQLLEATPHSTVHRPIQPPKSDEQATHKGWCSEIFTDLSIPKQLLLPPPVFLQVEKNKSHVCFLGALQILRRNIMQTGVCENESLTVSGK